MASVRVGQVYARAYDTSKPDLRVTEVTDTNVFTDNGPFGPGQSTLEGFKQFVDNGDYVLKYDPPE
ncbi:hypothetical protein [Catellatospora sichuanensis]|uniref:hypothetical protein n=1 Tax=Catellatospora sichuanensis TaxID=1969805 RepID=UPI00118343D3|nr:hypothetical protein [Catellatospora sichuanensis]